MLADRLWFRKWSLPALLVAKAESGRGQAAAVSAVPKKAGTGSETFVHDGLGNKALKVLPRTWWQVL